MRVVVVYKTDPAFSPSVMSTCQWLSRVGCDVVLVCVDPSPSVALELEAAGITVHPLPGSTEMRGTLLIRAARWMRFTTGVWRHLNELLEPGAVLWVASVETAVALGGRLFQRSYILQIQELYDRELRYRLFLRRLVQNAKALIVPEENRAALLRLWYRPTAKPFIIPNKPFYSREQLTDISLQHAGIDGSTIESLFRGRKTLLYQGIIDLSERDLLPLARACKRRSDDWQLVLMGHDLGSSLKRIRRECPSLVHLPFVAPPYHLKITELAYAGVVAYSWNALNTVYCAPNKTWEYALCGKPMLCNDVPGLTGTVGRYKAGICVDFRDEPALGRALNRLESDYGAFVQGTSALYASFDAESTFRQVLLQIDPNAAGEQVLSCVEA
jgi:glycosyltransferase involved in cell wall biosynthesis